MRLYKVKAASLGIVVKVGFNTSLFDPLASKGGGRMSQSAWSHSRSDEKLFW